MESREDYALKCIGYAVRGIHAAIAIFILGVILLSNSILWLIAVILLELCILGLWQYLDNKCILTLLEERLTGEKVVNASNTSEITWMNGKLGAIFGAEKVDFINAVHPYIVISILCAKILLIYTVAAPPI